MYSLEKDLKALWCNPNNVLQFPILGQKYLVCCRLMHHCLLSPNVSGTPSIDKLEDLVFWTGHKIQHDPWFCWVHSQSSLETCNMSARTCHWRAFATFFRWEIGAFCSIVSNLVVLGRHWSPNLVKIHFKPILCLTFVIFGKRLMYLFLLTFASNTAIAVSTASSKLPSSSLSHSATRTALVIVRTLTVHCNISNSVARSEVRGIIAVKVDCYLFLPWNRQTNSQSVSVAL